MTKSYLENVVHTTQNRQFSLHHTIVPDDSDLVVYLHWQDDIEIFYLEKGEASLTIEGTDYQLKAGDAVVIPPGLLHISHRLSPAPCAFFALCFSPEYITDSIKGNYYSRYLTYLLSNRQEGIHVICRTETALLEHVRTIFTYFEQPLEQCELSIQGHLLILWQMLYNQVYSKRKMHRLADRNSQRLQPLLTYLSEHAAEDISLDFMANYVSMSPGYFCRTFQKVTGFTPFSYLNRTRILNSCCLLQDTDTTITEIASLNGYNNVSYFNRSFRKIMGMTPSEYRKYQTTNPIETSYTKQGAARV